MVQFFLKDIRQQYDLPNHPLFKINGAKFSYQQILRLTLTRVCSYRYDIDNRNIHFFVEECSHSAAKGESCVRVFLRKYINLQNYLRWGIQVFGKRVDKCSYGAFRKWDINCMTGCYILVTCHKFNYLLALCSTIINQIYTFSINAYRLTIGLRIYEIG